jgi:hypothetical protein
MATKSSTKETGKIYVPKIDREWVQVTLIGDTQLVVHDMSEKARKELSHTEAKTAKGPRKVRIPEEEAQACLILLPDGRPGFPTRAFKAAMADAALLNDAVRKIDIRRLVWIHGDLVPIEPGTWTMREDIVRLSGPSRTPEIRWRPEFWPWRVTLTIQTQPDLLPVESIINLLDWAGAFIGVGEDRPGKSGGDWGRFHVAKANELIE